MDTITSGREKEGKKGGVEESLSHFLREGGGGRKKGEGKKLKGEVADRSL